MTLLVVKVGGSLYDLPDLGQRLRGFLASLGAGDRLIVPGGGPTADVVRAFDRDHGLGPSRRTGSLCALAALNAHLLARLLPGARIVPAPDQCEGVAILDPFKFVLADEGQPGCLPHHWDATSDSVAARVAVVARAGLILLKSISLPDGMSWRDAATAGHVDPTFPGIVGASGVEVRVVNLRSWSG